MIFLQVIFKTVILLSLFLSSQGKKEWHRKEGPLSTVWSQQVSRHPLSKYPRPQLTRPLWMNLNGLWDFAATSQNTSSFPDSFQKILVPFPVQSALSGVMSVVNATDRLWFRKSFIVPTDWFGKSVILHFGAVDWDSEVWVNGNWIGRHRGGFDSFSFDISYALIPNDKQLVTVSVLDPIDSGSQPRGKQVTYPSKIWYTSSSGIWHTVWLEPVAREGYVHHLKIDTDYDASRVDIDCHIMSTSRSPLTVNVTVMDRGEQEIQSLIRAEVSAKTVMTTVRSSIIVPNPKHWSPASPYIYYFTLQLIVNGSVIDEIESYFAIRKISIGKVKSFTKILLNDQPLFQYGLLDQGFWPDGLYTAPCDEALRFDIETTKRLGFNMIRKHVKVEPDRWYYWCDLLGVLVWQDMPSGDRSTERYSGPDIPKDKQAAEQFELEWSRIMSQLHNHPSIVVWVPFNEGWGQYDTARISSLTKQLDPSRLVDSASGWIDRGVGDIVDVHNYPAPIAPVPETGRASVLGEFGGLGMTMTGHTWHAESWSYKSSTDTSTLVKSYLKLIKVLKEKIESAGLSAAIYTQTSDVESEVNGIMTYDRRVMKIDTVEVINAHRALINK